jgi:hypothetical protein
MIQFFSRQLCRYSDEITAGRPRNRGSSSGNGNRFVPSTGCPEKPCGVPELLFSGFHGWVSPEVKRPGLEPDNSPSSSVEIKNVWSYTYIFASVFMAFAGTTFPLLWQTCFVSDGTWLRFSNRRQIFLTSSWCRGGDLKQELLRVLYLLPVLSFTVTLTFDTTEPVQQRKRC